jgi:hypothetical protein
MRTSLAILLGVMAGAGSLTACSDEHTITGYASASTYNADITTCIQDHDCAHLCTDVIKIPQGDVDESRILKHDQYGAKFACEVPSAAGTAFPGGTLDDGIDWDDDDNSCDDCDDSTDGSGDDNSGDSNSGDSTSGTDSSSSSTDSGSSDSNDDDCSTSGGTTWFCAFAALGVVVLRRRT